MTTVDTIKRYPMRDHRRDDIALNDFPIGALSDLPRNVVPQRWHTKRVPILILLFIFVAGLADAVQAIPMLQVWRFFICQDTLTQHDLDSHSRQANTFAESAQCQTAQISKDVANFDGWINAIGMILSVFTGLLYGRMSDIRGRLPVLRICVVGSLISQLLTLLAMWYWSTTRIWGILIAEVILGITGGSPVLISTCYAILSDVLEKKERLTWFARSVGIWYASRIIGPIIGSWFLIQQLLAPAYLATVLFVLSVPIALAIPETSDLLLRRAEDRVHPLQELRQAIAALSFCFKTRNLTIISAANLSYYFGVQIISILTIYVNMLGWSMESAGYLSSYQAIMKFFVAVVLIPYVKGIALNYWNMPSGDFDVSTTQCSFAVDALSWLLIAVLPARGLLPTLALGTLGIAASSSMRALAVSQVSTSDHGRLFASLGVVDALGAAIAAPSLSHIYGFTVATAPETVFLVVAIIFGFSSILFHWYDYDVDESDPSRYREVHDNIE